MQNKDLFIGIDLGGTTIKMAIIQKDGLIIKKWETPTNTLYNGKNIPQEIAASLFMNMKKLGIDRRQIQGIGMGAPAFLEMSTGFVYQAVNIGWENFPLKETLEAQTGYPIFIDNDANTAALGEMWKGSGKGSRNILFITLGTGVGGGLILNGQIVHGANGMAGEIGHITVEPNRGVPCNCGKLGCLETVASATGLVRMTKATIEDNRDSVLFTKKNTLSAKDIFGAAKNEDPFACTMVDKMANYLGLALGNLANAINPEKIIIGGGVSRSGNLLIKNIEKHFGQFALPRVRAVVEIKCASLGNDAGVLGAAWLVKNKME